MLNVGSTSETIARFQKAAPVDVFRLADALGLTLFFDDLGSKISAKIQRDPFKGGPAGFVIYVNAAEPHVRQRFSAAHEIAHYVLHRDLIQQGVTDDTMYRSTELSSYYETQANQMAADILMPASLVRERAALINSANLLAMQFQVSKAAMEIRLKGLKVPFTP
nr:protein of unknown function (DUF955) [uncultured bacterium]